MRLLSTLIVLLLTSGLLAQDSYTISGVIRDAETGETVLGASIFDKESGAGTTSNLYGFYSLTLPEGSYNLVYSFIGYVSGAKPVELTADLTIN